MFGSWIKMLTASNLKSLSNLGNQRCQSHPQTTTTQHCHFCVIINKSPSPIINTSTHVCDYLKPITNNSTPATKPPRKIAPSLILTINFEIFLHIKLGMRIFKTNNSNFEHISKVFWAKKDTYVYTVMSSRKGKRPHMHKHHWTGIKPLPVQLNWKKRPKETFTICLYSLVFGLSV